jgi:cytochrome c-type biogenesis protein CcmE
VKPGYLVGGFVILFCVVVTAMALSGTVRRTVTFAEAQQMRQPCEVYGEVVPKSVSQDLATGRFSFELKEAGTGTILRVVSLKSKPANFDQASHVKAIGQMAGDRFAAQDMLIKCPSKYQGVPKKPETGVSSRTAPRAAPNGDRAALDALSLPTRG